MAPAPACALSRAPDAIEVWLAQSKPNRDFSGKTAELEGDATRTSGHDADAATDNSHNFEPSTHHERQERDSKIKKIDVMTPDVVQALDASKVSNNQAA